MSGQPFWETSAAYARFSFTHLAVFTSHIDVVVGGVGVGVCVEGVIDIVVVDVLSGEASCHTWGEAFDRMPSAASCSPGDNMDDNTTTTTSTRASSTITTTTTTTTTTSTTTTTTATTTT
jgi:hypothetical protein